MVHIIYKLSKEVDTYKIQLMYMTDDVEFRL